ncbi:MAG: hypothetical protein J6Z17_05850, partial [Treponema sp.]|nr:hypothetical protein [Treponema sp.]
EEAEEARADAEEARADAEEAQKEADDAYAEAEKKQAEADEERREIAKDQQEVISKALNEAKDGNTVVGLKVTDAQTHLSAMVRVNSENGETLKESPVTVIRGRTIIPVSDVVLDGGATQAAEVTGSAVQIDTSLLYMAICGENTGLGAVKLCLLDAYLMEIQKESAETVAEDSVLVEKDGEYFCVIEDNGNNVLAKFDKNLTLKTKSSINLNPATPVTITDRGIIVTTAENRTALLKVSDLTAVTQQNQQQAPAAADEAQGYAK